MSYSHVGHILEDVMPTSVRLDSQTESLIGRLAKRRRKTKSEIIREAITILAQRESANGKALTPFQAMEPLLGCAKGGPTGLSQRTGNHFREILRSKKR